MSALTTSWSTPYALVRRGGVAEGKRPFTRLAFITRAIARDGKIVSLKCVLVRSDWTPCSAERDLDGASIVRQWRHRPTAAAIRTTKRSLAPSETRP